MTENEYLLAKDPRQAMEEMIKLTNALVERIEIETNAVATNDGTTFSMNEPQKESVAAMYEQASNEFHARINEFKKVDPELIRKLDEVQQSLGQSTKNNLALLEKVQKQQKENEGS